MILSKLSKEKIVSILTPLLHSHTLHDYNRWRHGGPKNEEMSLVEGYARLPEIFQALSDDTETQGCLDSARNALKILLDNAEKTNIPVPCEVVAELEYIISVLGS